MEWYVYLGYIHYTMTYNEPLNTYLRSHKTRLHIIWTIVKNTIHTTIYLPTYPPTHTYPSYLGPSSKREHTSPTARRLEFDLYSEKASERSGSQEKKKKAGLPQI